MTKPLSLGIAVCLAVVGVAAIRQPAVLSDSTHYISIAANMLHGRYADFTGAFPQTLACLPGYPALLALCGLLTLSLDVGPRAILLANFLALLWLYWLAYTWLRRLVPSKLGIAGAAAICLHPLVVTAANCALSETLFAAVLLAYVLSVADGRYRLAVLLALPLCLTRYLGVGVVLGSLACFPAWRWRALALLPGAALATAFAYAGHGAWWCGKPLWTVLGQIGGGSGMALGGPVMALFFALVLAESWRDRASRAIGASALGYLAVLVLMAVLSNVGDLNDRMLVPLVAPALVWLLSELWRGKARGSALLAAALVAFCVVNGVQAAHARITANETDAGFNAPRWQRNQLMAALRDIPGERIVSNSPEAVWWVTRKASRRMPYVGDNDSVIAAKLGLDSARSVIVVWKDYLPNVRYLTPEMLLPFMRCGRCIQDSANNAALEVTAP